MHRDSCPDQLREMFSVDKMEKIINEKLSDKGTYKYHIKWKGLKVENSSWEKEKVLTLYRPDLLTKWEEYKINTEKTKKVLDRWKLVQENRKIEALHIKKIEKAAPKDNLNVVSQSQSQEAYNFDMLTKENQLLQEHNKFLRAKISQLENQIKTLSTPLPQITPREKKIKTILSPRSAPIEDSDNNTENAVPGIKKRKIHHKKWKSFSVQLKSSEKKQLNQGIQTVKLQNEAQESLKELRDCRKKLRTVSLSHKSEKIIKKDISLSTSDTINLKRTDPIHPKVRPAKNEKRRAVIFNEGVLDMLGKEGVVVSPTRGRSVSQASAAFHY